MLIHVTKALVFVTLLFFGMFMLPNMLFVSSKNIEASGFEMILILSLHPICMVFYSAIFLTFAMERANLEKTVLYLKCFSIFMMPLAIEALIRSMMYVRNIWGNLHASIILPFLLASIWVLCFCIFTLVKNSTASPKKHNYRLFLWLLFSMIAVFPLTSIIFEASYQIILAWGATATALYGLSKCDVPGAEMEESKKRKVTGAMTGYCVKLTLWMMVLFFIFGSDSDPECETRDTRAFRIRFETAVVSYLRSHSEDMKIFRELSETETVDLTNQINLPKTKYIRTGAATVVLKNRKISTQYNIDLWRYCKRGVPLLGFGAYNEISLEDYKKQLARSSENLNSTELNSRYDGIGNEFYRDVTRTFF